MVSERKASAMTVMWYCISCGDYFGYQVIVILAVLGDGLKTFLGFRAEGHVGQGVVKMAMKPGRDLLYRGFVLWKVEKFTKQLLSPETRTTSMSFHRYVKENFYSPDD